MKLGSEHENCSFSELKNKSELHSVIRFCFFCVFMLKINLIPR